MGCFFVGETAFSFSTSADNNLISRRTLSFIFLTACALHTCSVLYLFIYNTQFTPYMYKSLAMEDHIQLKIILREDENHVSAICSS